jgi:hypothetical protein
LKNNRRKNMSNIRYDFGGAQCPYDDNIILVDNISDEDLSYLPLNEDGKRFKNKLIRQDIFEHFQLNEKATFINVSSVIGYHIDAKWGWSSDKEINYEKIKILTNNIINHLDTTKKCTVRLYDYMILLEGVIEILLDNHFTISTCNLVRYREIDCPAEWEVIMEKT